MHLAAMTAQQIGGLVWYLFMAGAGIGLALTGPKYLHLIDKGFPAKSRSNPEGAAKQVKTFRIIGAALGVCGLALAIMSLLGAS
jgi:hypothetical protein